MCLFYAFYLALTYLTVLFWIFSQYFYDITLYLTNILPFNGVRTRPSVFYWQTRMWHLPDETTCLQKQFLPIEDHISYVEKIFSVYFCRIAGQVLKEFGPAIAPNYNPHKTVPRLECLFLNNHSWIFRTPNAKIVPLKWKSASSVKLIFFKNE